MTRQLTLGLVGLIALSSAVSMVHATKEATPDSAIDDVEIPTFKSTKIEAPFLEQFTYGWPQNWHTSNATKESSDNGEIFSYVGQWSVEAPHVFSGMKDDLGLVAKTPAAHHAVSASISKPIDNTEKTLVVQYEVKAQNDLVCGGAYMKLLTDSNDGIKFKEFSNETPYTIMFGPDKCGTTDKVHFIFRHKNPITGVYEEKHLESAPQSKVGRITSLYTLVVRPDQTFEIKINNQVMSSGSLLEDFKPPVNPPKIIDDPKDSKPTDWVDEAKIPDPNARKPDDWDENAPPKIPDEKATKPDDWLESEETEIPDPEAVKPEDWDDDEDGDWVAPLISNPKCQGRGCGPWIRPLISNPNYKGKWSPPMIDNPAYKGVWAPRKIPNPNFFEDLQPSRFEKIGAVGFEIWTIQNDLLFDNIYIGHSVKDAETLAAETWEVKYAVEKQLEELANPTKKNEDSKEKSKDKELTLEENPVAFILQDLREFFAMLRKDPSNAVNTNPLSVFVLSGIVGVGFGLMLIILGLKSGVSNESATAQTKKSDMPTADDKKQGGEDEDASASGSAISANTTDEQPVRRRTNVAGDAE
ncbi:hypothetical protein BX616_000657 [Lobosporangium transversale]|uniref:Calreticulin family-domain-containing protein n=1 Tax=Lobosporangium transversale TaxID=64571 RepID=A0A1Y2G8E4_9FUNG|nr:Calreticulin family-domain-containing protein [Lobosporangium transversale]KAF9906683.1 hypothetical protein BX616_000657 [Lobosporangium transversale]ORY99612.1 Calreticulin family-domain-containing protein [Lobosporangium transversale]|eukprot:XP_021875907.1 Calreticulin family-domain-containing protein [Lobosporangium transversale]